MNIVWFKRDLRITDHHALTQATKRGPILPLYIFEPELWHQPDMSYRHYIFLQDCLAELDQALQSIGQRLIIKVGEATKVLQDLQARHPIKCLWSHQETWNDWTYKRDIAVKHWCQSQNIVWHELVQNGVIRGLSDRNGWARRWFYRMKQPLTPAPSNLHRVEETTNNLPNGTVLQLYRHGCDNLQQGGRSEGLKLLDSFLQQRGENYTKEMSSPVTAYKSCSRLSTHIAFGTLSIRELFQACEQRHQNLKLMAAKDKGKWPSAMRSFSGRLRWHCHFIQKLENEPRIEFENLHPAYNTLRTNDLNDDHFRAWKYGMTGYPMVDACMRALRATGWLNFRMRAMIMSFASYHLWMHWRKPALYLARLFTDYEPGIHYSQVQMQSGTTGINAIRIYNPIKQGIDHDPDGEFIRRWIPELSNIDSTLIHTPWCARSKMNDYPMPIVDEKTARKYAADQLYGLRKNDPSYRAIANKIVHQHASRKKSSPKSINEKKTKNQNPNQGELPL